MKETENVSKQGTKVAKKGPKMIVFIIVGILLMIILGMQVYASTNGYGNVFFMIKELVTTGSLSGEKEIFSDKEITLSYKTIEVAEGVEIQVNKLELKENESTLCLKVTAKNGNSVAPLNYEIAAKGMEKTKITATNSVEQGYYDEKLTIKKAFGDEDVITLYVEDKDGNILKELEIDLKNREIVVKGEESASKISQIELKKYLNVFSELNSDQFETDVDKGMWLAHQVIFNKIDDIKMEWNIETVNTIIKEVFGNKISFVEVTNSKGNKVEVVDLEKSNIYEYYEAGNDYSNKVAIKHTPNGICLKIEDIKYEDGIYTVKYIYTLAYDDSTDLEHIEELPQYEATIKLKRNENAKYSKYQIVELSKGTEVKEKVSTKVEEEEEDNIPVKGYGPGRIIRNEVRSFLTENPNYTDMFNITYKIKELKDYDIEYVTSSNDKTVDLYKVVVDYVNQDNKDDKMELAVLLNIETEEPEIKGTYINYTGTTSYVKIFTNLYNNDNENNEVLEKIDYDISIKNESKVVIKATEDGYTVTDEFDMGAAIDKVDTMRMPVVGDVALVTVSGGESYIVNIYQKVNGKIEFLGSIDCGADMVKEATYDAQIKDENIISITAYRNEEKIQKEFKTDVAIVDTDVIDIMNLGKVVLEWETGGEYYGMKIYRLSEDYTTGKTKGLIEAGNIKVLKLMK